MAINWSNVGAQLLEGLGFTENGEFSIGGTASALFNPFHHYANAYNSAKDGLTLLDSELGISDKVDDVKSAVSSTASKVGNTLSNVGNTLGEAYNYLLSNGTLSNALLNSAAAQIEQAQATNQFNAEQAQINRDFNAKQAALNRTFQLNSAREAMDFEANQAQILRSWQEVQNQKAMDYNTEMSNTAYQRAVKDLQAAGLNPILAYTNGGASTPSGVTSSGASASGKQASGSAASGSAASGVQANVRGYINELTGALSDIASSASKVVDAVLPW